MTGELLFLLGPTAAGKTDLAVPLAEALGAEILSLDSMAVYRRMEVGTAKPDGEARARVPHHLVDLVEPWEGFDVARYRQAALEACAQVAGRGRRTLFVGGTPFYFMALVKGLFAGPPAQAELRRRLLAEEESHGPGTLHRRLAAVDPVAAGRLHPRDRKRLVRALEVREVTGLPLSSWQTQWQGRWEAGGAWRAAVLHREPAVLRERIRRRTAAMLAGGLVAETESILAAGGFSPQAAAALGYAQVLAMMAGRLAPAALAEAIATRTWNLVRKQRTWLRKIPGVRPIDPETTKDPLGVLIAFFG